MTEGVDGNDRVSGIDKEICDEKSYGSFTKFGSPYENVCAIQCGSIYDEVEGLKGFSRVCSEVVVEPK